MNQNSWERFGKALSKASQEASPMGKFDPDQPRDEGGKWSGSGGGSGKKPKDPAKETMDGIGRQGETSGSLLSRASSSLSSAKTMASKWGTKPTERQVFSLNNKLGEVVSSLDEEFSRFESPSAPAIEDIQLAIENLGERIEGVHNDFRGPAKDSKYVLNTLARTERLMARINRLKY